LTALTHLEELNPKGTKITEAGQCDCQPVITFAADGLNRGGAYTLLGGNTFVEAADALHTGIGAGTINHSFFSDDVIRDDDTAQP
jgi:hypothetical protein